MADLNPMPSRDPAGTDEPIFGSWAAREFRAPKATAPIIAQTRLHEDYLIIASLDPGVRSIAPAPAGLFPPDAPCPPDFIVEDEAEGTRYVHVLAEEQTEAVKARLHDAHRAAERAGIPYKVVDAAEICAEPRLRNARMVYACRRVRVSPGDRVRILHFLGEGGESTLIEASRVVSGSQDSVECVLALAVEGTVSVDLRRTLGPEMPVRRLSVESDHALD